MNKTFKLSALFAITIFSQSFSDENADWVGSVSNDMNTAANWSPAIVPTDAALFDSTFPPISFTPSANALFSVGILEFLNSAQDFTFTFTGPGALQITDAGIRGLNVNPQMTATNTTAMTTAQVYINASTSNVSLGAGSWNLTNQAAGSLSMQNAAQLILGDADVFSVSPVVSEDGVSFTLTNNGIISGVNEAGQIFLKGSTYFGGSQTVIQLTNAGGSSSISSNSDTGQIVLDAGSSMAVMSFEDDLTGSFSNQSSIESISRGNNVGQFVIDGKDGTAGIMMGNDATFTFTSESSAVISTVTTGNDAGQLVLDGNNGVAYFMARDNMTMTFANESGSSISGLGFDTGQLVVDGDDGTAFFFLGNDASLTFSNASDCSISGGSDGNDTGQIVIDGNGSLAYLTMGLDSTASLTNEGQISGYFDVGQIVVDSNNAGAYFNCGDNSVITLTNSGEITNLQNGHTAGQLVFSGDFGSTVFNAGNNSTITVINTETGTITNVGPNLGQMYFSRTTINGSPTLAAVNRSSTPMDGIVFAAGTTANNAKIDLTNSSFIVNVGDSFTMIAALQGDGASSVYLYNDLVINTPANFAANFAGTIMDGSGSNSLVIEGTGTQQLSGTNTFSGTTTISEGAKLILTGSLIGDVFVSGTLSGTGMVDGLVTVEPGATMAPGLSPGTLTVGSLTLDSSSKTLISLTADEGASNIVVTDIASLAGTVAVSQEDGDYQRKGHYPIVLGSYTGQFNSTVTGGLPGFLFSLSYGTDAVYLDYKVYQMPTKDLSGNARKVARYLNRYAAPSTLALFEGFSESSLKKALNSISPSRNAFGNYITQQTMLSLSSLLAGHMDLLRTKSKTSASSPALAALVADASDQIHSASDQKGPFSVWVSGFGEYAHQKSQGQNPSFNFISEAALAGVDCRLGEDNFVGGAIGYAHTHFIVAHHMGHGNINYYFSNLYGNAFVGDFYFAPAVWGVFNENHNTRNISFSGFSDKAKANIFAWQLVPHLEVGYQAVFSWGEILPFTAADWAISWQRKYHEEGASPFNARSASKSNSMVRSETGLKFCEKWDRSWGAFFLREKLSYVFEKPYGTGNVQTALTGIPTSFTVTAVNRNLNLGDVGIDFSVAIGKTNPLEINFAYEGEFGSQYQSHQANLTLSSRF